MRRDATLDTVRTDSRAGDALRDSLPPDVAVTDTVMVTDSVTVADSGADAADAPVRDAGLDVPVATDVVVATDTVTTADAGTDVVATDTGAVDVVIAADVRDAGPPSDTGTVADAGSVPAGMCLDAVTGLARPIVSPTAGQLLINEWMADPASPLIDADAEWFELRATAAVDLNGLQAGTATLTALVPAGPRCVSVAAGGFALFAQSAVPADNGGLTNVAGTFTFALVNGAGTLQIGFGGTQLATVSWTPVTSGRSNLIDSDGTQCLTAAIPANAYSPSNFGTPGASNTPPECP